MNLIQNNQETIHKMNKNNESIKSSKRRTRKRSDSGVSSIQTEDEIIDEYSKDAKLCLNLIKKLKNCFLDENYLNDEKLTNQINKIRKSVQISNRNKEKLKNKKNEFCNLKDNQIKSSNKSKDQQISPSIKNNNNKKSNDQQISPSIKNNNNKKSNEKNLKSIDKEHLKSTDKENTTLNDKKDKLIEKKGPNNSTKQRSYTFSCQKSSKIRSNKRNNSLSDDVSAIVKSIQQTKSNSNLIRLPIGPNNKDNGFKLKRTN